MPFSLLGCRHYCRRSATSMLVPLVTVACGLFLFLAGTCACYGIPLVYLAVPTAVVCLVLVGGLCMGVLCIVSSLRWLSGHCLPSPAQWMAYAVFWGALFGAGLSLPVAGLSGKLVHSCTAGSQHELYWWLSCLAWAALLIECIYTYNAKAS